MRLRRRSRPICNAISCCACHGSESCAAKSKSTEAEGESQRSTDASQVPRQARRKLKEAGRRRRASMQNVRYFAFADPSGGSADSMSLAIGHREDDIVVLDALREIKPPFSPDNVVGEFSALLKSYRVSKITGDRYAGEWPRERFREHGIVYEPAQKPKSDFYRDLLPAINSRKLDLLDDARLLTQLVSLERRTARGGRDSIDHPPNTHDDLANAIAGLCGCTRSKYAYDCSLSWVS